MQNGIFTYHGAAEARPVEGWEGVLLQRVPEAVRVHLREGAKKEYIRPAGAEIRFALDGKNEKFSVTLASYNGGSKMKVFFGDYEYEEYQIGVEPTTIEVGMVERFSDGKGKIPARRFGDNVVRLMFGGEGVNVINLSVPYARAVRADELPKLKQLSYGTSITQGFKASSPSLCYAYLTAEKLGADLYNYGCSGNAFCEPELADYLCEQEYDYATLELSVNMFNGGLTIEEYYNRIKYLTGRMAEKSNGRPIICISFFPYFYDLGIRNPKQSPKGDPDDYRAVFEKIVEEIHLPNLHFISGKELFTDFTGLTADLLHPSNKGMAEIAEKLTARIKETVNLSLKG